MSDRANLRLWAVYNDGLGVLFSSPLQSLCRVVSSQLGVKTEIVRFDYSIFNGVEDGAKNKTQQNKGK